VTIKETPMKLFWLAAIVMATTSVARGVDNPLAPAIAQYDAGRYAEAQRSFAAYATAHPSDGDAAYWNGRALLALKQPEQAIEALEQAAKLLPRRSDVFLALCQADGTAAQAASLLHAAGLARRSRTACETALALDGGNLDAREFLVQFHLIAPGLMGGSVDEARKQADEIGKRDTARGAMACAQIAQHDKDLRGAERILLEALQHDATSTRLRLSLGQLYQAEKKWDAAFAAYDALLAQNGDDWLALYQVGRTAALSGQRLDRGAAALRRYLGHPPTENEPPLANAHYRLGMVLERQGDRAGARTEYQAALRLDPRLDDAKTALTKLG
jgi:tetratricopeptide (TPR) repeat protein